MNILTSRRALIGAGAAIGFSSRLPRTIPGEEAFRPLSEGACEMVHL